MSMSSSKSVGEHADPWPDQPSSTGPPTESAITSLMQDAEARHLALLQQRCPFGGPRVRAVVATPVWKVL
jgi:hypothetical protein